MLCEDSVSAPRRAVPWREAFPAQAAEYLHTRSCSSDVVVRRFATPDQLKPAYPPTTADPVPVQHLGPVAAMSATQANTVPDTQLGLTNEEIALLRHHQAQATGANSSSSRAASRASSQGVLMIDSSSLTALGRHFDRVMQHIQQQLEYLSSQAEIVTMQVYDRAGELVDNADAEIARYNQIIQQIDELEVDFDRIRHIRDIVRDFRRRAEQLERDLESAERGNPSRRERHGHSGRHSGKHRHH